MFEISDLTVLHEKKEIEEGESSDDSSDFEIMESQRKTHKVPSSTLHHESIGGTLEEITQKRIIAEENFMRRRKKRE